MDTHQQFIEDMESVGIKVNKEYYGRYFYRGPAVVTTESGWPTRQDVMRATAVQVQWDNMGREDYVVYPK